MADLQKRTRTNPFYAEALRMLGKRNFHLVTADYAPAGGIKLIVHVQDRQQRETTREFVFPARLEGLAMMQWKVGFSRDLDEMEKAGFRPSRAQFERAKPEPTPTAVVTKPIETLPVPERKEENVVHLRSVEPSQEPEVPDPKMEIVLDTRVSSLITMLMLNEIGEFVNDPEVRVSLAVPTSRLSDFLSGVNQCDAKVVVINPPKSPEKVVERVEAPPVPVEKPKPSAPSADPYANLSLAKVIRQTLPNGEAISSKQIIETIRKHSKKWSQDVLTIRVSKVLSNMTMKGKVKRIGRGTYRKIG